MNVKGAFAGLFVLVCAALAIPSQAAFPGFQGILHTLLFLIATFYYVSSWGRRHSVLSDKVSLKCLALFFAIGAGMFASLLANDTTSDALLGLRFHILQPFVLAVLGYTLADSNRKSIAYALLACGVVNAALGYVAVLTTPVIQLPSGNWAGGATRLWLHPLTHEEFPPTQILMNSIGAGLAGCLMFAFSGRVYPVLSAFGLVSFIGLGLLSGTRGGLVAVGLVFAVLIVKVAATKRIRISSRICLFLLISFCIAAFIAFREGSIHGDRFLLAELFEGSITGRTHIWAMHISNIANAPLGMGFVATLNEAQSAHNLVLEVFYSYGWLPGFCLVVASAIAGAHATIALVKHRANSVLVGFAACIVVVLLYSLIEAPLRSSTQAFYMSFLVSGAFLRSLHLTVGSRTSKDHSPRKPTARASQASASLVQYTP
jgi:hypothetical protein